MFGKCKLKFKRHSNLLWIYATIIDKIRCNSVWLISTISKYKSCQKKLYNFYSIKITFKSLGCLGCSPDIVIWKNIKTNYEKISQPYSVCKFRKISNRIIIRPKSYIFWILWLIALLIMNVWLSWWREDMFMIRWFDHGSCLVCTHTLYQSWSIILKILRFLKTQNSTLIIPKTL